MPCEYYTPQEAEQIAREELNKATRVACELAKALQGLGVARVSVPLSQEALEWISAHEAMDKRRLEIERERTELARVKAEGLAKLTDQEREALGV